MESRRIILRSISTNYAKASEGASNAALRKSLQDLLQNRDTVTAALSKADPASASQLQAIFAETQAATKAQP